MPTRACAAPGASRSSRTCRHRRHLGAVGADQAKTDAACMFAIIHVMLHEHPRERLDLAFLRDVTPRRTWSAQRLLLREAESGKPLLFDSARNAAVPFDTPDIVPLIEGACACRRRSKLAPTGSGGRMPTSKPIPLSPSSSRTCASTARSGGADLRGAGGDDPPPGRRVPRKRLHRRDDRGRRPGAAVRPVA